MSRSRRNQGSVYRNKYYATDSDGKRRKVREATRTSKRSDAVKLLNKRLAEGRAPEVEQDTTGRFSALLAVRGASPAAHVTRRAG